MDREFWNGRRVLVTGHTGFKGSWLCEMLLGLGAKVSGLSLEPPKPGLFDLLELGARTESTIGDIRDASAVVSTVSRSNAQIVFHLAAQSLVRPSYSDPVTTFDTNVMGTVRVLDALRTRGENVQACVVVTSDKCYENKESLAPYRETDRLGGHDPYSNSKACAELAVQSYRDAFPLLAPTASARAGNVIGGGDWAAERLVPDIVRSARENRVPVLRYPNAVRPWQHVLEPLSGYVRLAERLASDPSAAGAWNFGPADAGPVTVAQVAEALLSALGRAPQWSTEPRPQPHEAGLLRVDSTKARTELGWSSKLDGAQTIQWTAQWYAAWMNGSDMKNMTRMQIDEYRAL